MIARHAVAPQGGWAWQSVIQSPHFQTDRDVGTASVVMGLLGLWQTTGNSAYLAAAQHGGDWLLAVAQTAPGGLRWPDYADPSSTSGTHYTSFDDGAAGIADVLWRLADATAPTDSSAAARYRSAALAGMGWLEGQAIPANGCTTTPCSFWRWTDNPTDTTTYTGLGPGVAGTAWTFADFADRTGNASYAAYARATGYWLESLMSASGAIPESPGNTVYDTGYVWGAAGDALLFLRLYRYASAHGDAAGAARWLTDAEKLLSWLASQAQPQPAGGDAWPIAVDPTGHLSNSLLATGVEEGAAGIGWVALQASRVSPSSDPQAGNDLTLALASARWLLATEQTAATGGNYWPEDYAGSLVHSSLDNGAPGIGVFLDDISRQTASTGNANPAYENAALGASTWLAGVMQTDALGVYWYENCTPSRCRLPADPSWHWGFAGIGGFLARMSGWTTDMPGEQPGF